MIFGLLLYKEQFRPRKRALISHILADVGWKKVLAFEESSAVAWMVRSKRDPVDILMVCDPCQNPLFDRTVQKEDQEDAYNPRRLLRLGSLKPVHHPVSILTKVPGYSD